LNQLVDRVATIRYLVQSASPNSQATGTLSDFAMSVGFVLSMWVHKGSTGLEDTVSISVIKIKCLQK
jgi:hypothetical protein